MSEEETSAAWRTVGAVADGMGSVARWMIGLASFALGLAVFFVVPEIWWAGLLLLAYAAYLLVFKGSWLIY